MCWRMFQPGRARALHVTDPVRATRARSPGPCLRPTETIERLHASYFPFLFLEFARGIRASSREIRQPPPSLAAAAAAAATREPWRRLPAPPPPTPTARIPPDPPPRPRGATAASAAAARTPCPPPPRSRCARTASPATSDAAGSGGSPVRTTTATVARALMTVTVRHLADHISVRRAVDQGSQGKGSEARIGIINETRVNIERRKRVNVLAALCSFPSSLVARRRKVVKEVLSLVKR